MISFSSLLLKRLSSEGKQKAKFLIVRMAANSSSLAERPIIKTHSLQFYRRPLPTTCIDFASAEGKVIFSEALMTGHMNAFFKLSSQYRTQDEPAYCGLTSLVMALNVLEIDPGRVWKGPWRWYHEDMLDCCTSLQLAREKGINMEQFICLARCNNLAVTSVSGSSIHSLEQLRAEIKAATLRDDIVFVASYSRKTLSQTGDGHFSPVAGYHEGRDLVLILDTARFKYPPHWVPLQTLLNAMKTVDPDTGRSRGYVILSRASNQPSLLLFRPSPALSIEKDKCSTQILQFAKEWEQKLNVPLTANTDKEVIKLVMSNLKDIKIQKYLSLAFFVLTLPFEQSSDGSNNLIVQCPLMVKGEDRVTCLIKNLMTELESLETFKVIQEYFKEAAEDRSKFLSFLQTCEVSCEDSPAATKQWTSDSCYSSEKCQSYQRLRSEFVAQQTSQLSSGCQPTCSNCEGLLTVGPEHATTLFLLAWPHYIAVYSSPTTLDLGMKGKSLGRWLKEYLSADVNRSAGRLIMDEINTVKVKINEVLTYHSDCKSPQCCSKP